MFHFMPDENARLMFNAIEAGDLAKVKLLVSADGSLVGAIVDNADAVGWAAFYAWPEIVKYFIDNGADMNWRTPRGTSALGFAMSGAQGAFRSHGVNRPIEMYE